MKFTSKELAKKFDLNHARLKRWAREFLPSETKAGFQCGYARKYDLQDAFILFLCFLLLELCRFSIQDTKVILGDIKDMLKLSGHFPPTRCHRRCVGIYASLTIQKVNKEFYYTFKDLIPGDFVIQSGKTIVKRFSDPKTFETASEIFRFVLEEKKSEPILRELDLTEITDRFVSAIN